MGWQELAFAQQLRDVVRELATQEVRRLRPGDQLATVSTIDTVNGVANVIYPGDTVAVPVAMHTIQPTAGGGVGVGDVVLVTGDSTRRRIQEVVKGSPLLKAGRVTLTALQTTASAANMFVDSATGIVYRSTSSLRYKKNVEPADVSEDAVMMLRAVTYQPKDAEDERTYLGLIAEEIAGIDDPTLDMLLELDDMGEPDAVAYDRLGVVLLPVVQHLVRRVRDLEARIDGQA